MSDRATRKAAAEAWRRVPRRSRYEVLRRAVRGWRHPDQAVAEAAEAWAQMTLRPVWWNRIPVWAFTALGLGYTAGGLRLNASILVAGGVVILLCTFLIGSMRRGASYILAVSPSHRTPTSPQ
jgi:hypothetical protein